jgi:hypothetical protein
MDNETTETDDPWWFNASCALVGCTWPLWLFLAVWLLLAICHTDPMGG